MYLGRKTLRSRNSTLAACLNHLAQRTPAVMGSQLAWHVHVLCGRLLAGQLGSVSLWPLLTLLNTNVLLMFLFSIQ